MTTEQLGAESAVVEDRMPSVFGDLDAIPKNSTEPGEFGDLSSIPKDEIASLTTYLYRIADDGTKMPTGFRRERYVMKRVGGIFDFDEIRERCGGGNFLIIVTATSGGRMLRCVRLSIEGDPKFERPEPAIPAAPVAPVAVAPPAANHPGDVERAVAVVSAAIAPILEQMSAAMRMMVERPQMPLPTPAAPTMTEVFGMLERSMKLGRESASAQPAADTERLLDMFERGIKLGRTTDGGKSIGEAIVEVAPKAIDAIATGLASRPPAPRVFVQRRAVAPSPGGAASPSGSVAVVEPAAQPATTDIAGRVRWLVEYLESMRASGADATKVADLLEDLLSEFEVKKLASYVGEHEGQTAVNVGAALADLGRFFPAPAGLTSEDGQRWLAEFLERLAQPADESDESPEGSSS